MAKYKITLIGLYSYSDALFDLMELPAVDASKPYNLDKETLVSSILERGGDFPVLYPNWDFMKYMIGVWSKNCQYMFNTLLDTMNADFNPMENYDRTSNITRSGSGTSSLTSESNSTSTGNGQVVNSQTSFNSDNFKDTSKDTSDNSSSGSDTSTNEGTTSSSETISERVHGNIGVRSGQELIEQSRNMAMFKLYDIITNDFINRFCIQLY